MIRIGLTSFILVAILVSVSAQVPELFPFRKKDKYGYTDVNGTGRLRFMFEVARPFSEEKAWVESKPWRGYIRSNGTWAYYDSVSFSGERMELGVAELRRHSGVGAIDSTGKVIVPFEYLFLQRYNQLRVILAHKDIMQDGAKQRVVHLYTYDGLKVPVDFDKAVSQKDASALGLRQKDKLWVYGKDGKPLLNYPVDDIYSRAYGTRVQLNGLFGAINRNGQMVLPIRYKSVWVSEWQPYAEFSTVAGDTSGYMDLDNGRIAFTFRAILSQPVSDNVAVISYVNNLHNVHDLAGKLIAQLVTYEDTARARQKDYVAHFHHMHYSDGIIAIRHSDKKWYAYNKQAKLAFPKGYEASFEFEKGVAIVRTNGYSFEYGMIDKQGREVLPLEYRNITRTSEPDVVMVEKGNQRGLVYTNGKVAFPVGNVNFRDHGNGFFLVEGNYTGNYFTYGYVNTRTGYIYYDPNDR